VIHNDCILYVYTTEDLEMLLILAMVIPELDCQTKMFANIKMK